MNHLELANRPSGSSHKRIKASGMDGLSGRDVQATYRYETGDINSGGQHMVAIVLGALPDEMGFFADSVLDTLVNNILVAEPNLSAKDHEIRVFVTTPPGLHVAPWRMFNLRVDRDREVSDVGAPQTVSSEVKLQLEIIFKCP